MTAGLAVSYGLGLGSGVLLGVFLARWLAKQRPDPYPGEDALQGYTKSEYGGQKVQDGEQKGEQ